MHISRVEPGKIEIKTKQTVVSIDKQVRIGALDINVPGEYDAEEVAVVGIAVDGQTVYSLSIEDVQVCSLPQGITNLPQNVTEQIGSVDVLLLPIQEGASSADLLPVINQVEPTMVIPYGSGDINQFAASSGAGADHLPHIKVTRSLLNPEERQTILLSVTKG